MIKAINNAVGIELKRIGNDIVLEAKFDKDRATERKIPIAKLQKILDEREDSVEYTEEGQKKGKESKGLVIHVVPGQRPLTTKRKMIDIFFRPPTDGADLIVVEKDDFINAVRELIK